MNAIEKKLQACEPRWVHYYRGYSTVVNGFGWIVFTFEHQMWLACVAPEVVEKQFKTHKPKDANQIVYCHHGEYPSIDLCFKIPATNSFLVQVVESAHEGIFRDAWETAIHANKGRPRHCDPSDLRGT
jgi:hypothetical protein